jgi:hypothetical protein
MVHFENSYRYGKKQETKVLPLINDYFRRKITAYTERWAKHDYFDELDYQYELKSRTNKLTTYPDTMITFNKITGDKPLILLFNYTDCLAYIEYNPEQFSKYKKNMFSRAQIEEDEKEHVYIPISDLTIISTY